MRKILAGLLCLSILGLGGLPAQAAHTIPGTNDPCDNGYYTMEERHTVSTSRETHGYNCTVTYYVNWHKKICTSCGGDAGVKIYQCTEKHTCGIEIKYCKVPYHD